MSDNHSIDPDFTTVAVVLCAIVGLVLVAAALPPMLGEGVTTGVDNQDSGEQLGEAVDANEQEHTAGDTGSGETDGGNGDSEEPSYELTVHSNDVPGTNATVSVTRDEDPVRHVPVFFDDEHVGTTDDGGVVEAQLPFAESVEITAVVDEGAVVTSGGSTGVVAEEQLSTTIDTDSDLTVQLSGSVYPGGEATVDVAVAGEVPVEDASVVLNDNTATTDEHGTVTIPIGEDADMLAVDAERGELQTSERVSLPLDVDADVSSRFGIPYALGTTTVSVDTPSEDAINAYDGATVYLLDEVVEDPDSDDLADAHTTRELSGSSSVLRLPVSTQATIVVDAGDDQQVFVLNDLVRNLGILVLVGTSLGFGVAITYGRIMNRSLRRDLTLAGRSFKFGALNFGALLHGLGTKYSPLKALGRTITGIGAGGGSLLAGVASLRIPRLPSVSLPSLSAVWATPSLPSLGLGSIRSDSSQTSEEPPTEDGDGFGVSIDEYEVAAVDVEETTEPDNRDLVRAAWHEFAETAGVVDVQTTTPGAAARQARAAGLPEPAIETLTTVFREVEYGRAAVTDERTDRALRALAVIRAHENEQTDGGETA